MERIKYKKIANTYTMKNLKEIIIHITGDKSGIGNKSKAQLVDLTINHIDNWKQKHPISSEEVSVDENSESSNYSGIY